MIGLAFLLGVAIGLALPYGLALFDGLVREQRGDYIDGWSSRERRQMMEKDQTH